MNTKRNAVTSRILGGTGQQFVGTGVLASSNVLIDRQCPPYTINHDREHMLPVHPFLDSTNGVKGTCPLVGPKVIKALINRKFSLFQAKRLSTQNQHDKEKRNPPTSNRGVTTPPAIPLLASVGA